MNKLLLLLVTVLTLSNDSLAARKKCILKIELDDQSPITVAIDNRDYKKVGTSMTFSDLPPGRHYIRVYEYKEYADNSGGHAKLIYTGSVKMKKNTVTQCVVNGSRGEMVVTTREMVMDETPKAIPATNGGGMAVRGTLSNQETDALGKEVKIKLTDTDKMKLLQSRLGNKTYTTVQVSTMMSWFNFEESRLEFAKWAYANTVNKLAYRDLENNFDYEASVTELQSFLSSRPR